MVLIFNDGGWTIASSNWSLGNEGEGGEETLLIYQWGQNGDTAKAWNLTIPRPLDAVLALVTSKAAEGVCDLRPLQGPA